jgi:hypothetical protein
LKQTLNIIASVLFFTSALAQVEKDGLPYSWLNGTSTSAIWLEFDSLDTAALLAGESSDFQLKNIPFRYADTVQVNISTETAGRWYNLEGGDRLWRIGFHIPNSKSMGIMFKSAHIPAGANVYMYNNANTDFSGPYTQSTADRSFMNTLPIPGDNIIVEYYEPFAHRGEGSLLIDAVLAGYRDLEEITNPVNASCLTYLTEDESRSLENPLKSVVLMVVDHGQRIATGTLINNTLNNGQAIVLTSASVLMGDPSSWLFIFPNELSTNCGSGVACWERALAGGTILATDSATGLALVALRQHPRNSWGAYYAGWSSENTNPDALICLQHALGKSGSIAYTNQIAEVNPFNALQTLGITSWTNGQTFPGSIGSPIFNGSGELEGVFVGGDMTCTHQGTDYYAPFKAAWPNFGNVLTPSGSTAFVSLQGFYPVYNESGSSSTSITLFPNPTSGALSIDNKSNDAIQAIVIYDSTGRAEKVLAPNFGRIDLSSISGGFCVLEIHQTSGAITRYKVLVVR